MSNVPAVGVLDGRHADTRRADPETSHEARDSISEEALAESQAEVLAILHLYGPQADHDTLTIHELRHGVGATQILLSGQRLRTARNELVELGLVVQTKGEALTPSGRRAKVWGVSHE
jgi:hypothetical protein